MKKRSILLLIPLFLLVARAYPVDVPISLQIKLMFKICSMDRNFSRFGNPIKIGVTSDEFLNEFNAVKGKLKIKGSDFEVTKMSSPDDVENCKIVYLGKNWAGNYPSVAKKAAVSKTLVFCQTEEGVDNGGAAISFKVIDKKPRIIVNLGNAKDQGTDFPAGFLKITVLVGNLK